jgi:hypothetical protein
MDTALAGGSAGPHYPYRRPDGLGVDVAGQGSAGSPGSDGALPYLSLALFEAPCGQ